MTSYVPAKEFEGELWVRAADFQKAISEAGGRSIADAEQQEPVAWYDAEKDCAYTLADCEGRAPNDLDPLYLAPPSNPWQGLTDEEIHNTEDYFESRTLYRFARAIETKLKEKNT